MRLWHVELIKKLDNKRLLSQHKECCMFRGKSYEKGNYPGYQIGAGWNHLLAYHFLVIEEMERRGYEVTKDWYSWVYRGKNAEQWTETPKAAVAEVAHLMIHPEKIMPKTMTEEYKQSCIDTINERTGNYTVTWWC